MDIEHTKDDVSSDQFWVFFYIFHTYEVSDVFLQRFLFAPLSSLLWPKHIRHELL